MPPARLLVTAGPPTSNGDLHVGHLSGPYIAADAFARFRRLHGERVCYFTAGDDHQSYVARKATHLNQTPDVTAAHFCHLMERTLRSADADLTFFGRPAQSNVYKSFIKQVFIRLLDNKTLSPRTSESLFCVRCQAFLSEAFIRGHCASCGASADGGICEECGRPNIGDDLLEPKCSICGSIPGVRSCSRLVFALEPHRKYLEEYIRTAVMGERHRALVEGMLARPLPEIPATQVSKWGLPVPLADCEQQRISAWFELGPHYLAVTADMCASGMAPGDWRDYWCGPGSEVIQFFGYDSCYFHTILFPAVFHAFDPTIRPPRGFVANEFLRLDGKKFSTSRGHALWGADFLRQHSSDAVRFYLGYIRPELEQTNFTVSEYAAFVQRELIGEWDGWLNELAVRVSNIEGIAPTSGDWRPLHHRFLARLENLLTRVQEGYQVDGFSLQAVTRNAMEIVRESRQFGRMTAFTSGLTSRITEQLTALRLELAAARALALASYPLMPNFSIRLWESLGYSVPLDSASWPERVEFIPAGQHLRFEHSPFFGDRNA
jgi:methionyl-tRNA synthetase